jgi:hypothetical protein
MSRAGTTLDTQRLKYHEVIWSQQKFYGQYAAIITSDGSDIQPELLIPFDTPFFIQDKPIGLITGMKADEEMPPYWVFEYKIDSNKGLVISNVKVKDTIEENSKEDVFERIEFGDMKIFFDNAPEEEVNFTKLFLNPTTKVTFETGEGGSGFGFNLYDPPDILYQRGIKLDVSSNILHESGGHCDIFLSFSIVFRGAKNDFDPGEIPVAMIAWPQISFSWSNIGNTSKVLKFIGSIKITMHNKMHDMHTEMHHDHDHSSVDEHETTFDENIVGFYTDSNTSLIDSRFASSPAGIKQDRATYYAGVVQDLLALIRLPIGWAIIFDYINTLKLNYNKITKVVSQKETEIIAVYGPDDSVFYKEPREKRYEWIPGNLSPGLRVRKVPRQGMYDNMHNHARMTNHDFKENIQLHAPFCGHSCIHTHWRWSELSSWGLFKDSPKFKGWSRPILEKSENLEAKAFSEHNAPKVPPNQKIRIAVCNTNANIDKNGNSHSEDNILYPGVFADLDTLKKMFWYRAEIIKPNAGKEQVMMEQGIGWAYRYATPTRFSTPLTPGFGGESDAVDGLTDLILGDDNPWINTPTQKQISDFFETKVYPIFRYKEVEDEFIDQVPEGSHEILFTSGGTPISMEDL